MRRPRLTLLVAASVAALSLPVASAVASAGSSDATTYRTFTDVAIPMGDGVTISANVFIPTKGCPCPTVLSQTPYRKSTTPDVFPTHGYVEVVTDVRGTGSSGGYWDVFGEREQKDGADVVRWITRQKWSNGRIGTYGGSYLGINQFLTDEQPGMSAIKAMFPIIPMSDAYRDVTWSAGAWDSSFMSWWYALVTGESLEPADYAQSNPQVALNVESQHLLDVATYTTPDLAADVMGAYQHQLCAATGNGGPTCGYPDASYDSARYRLSSPMDRIANVHVPTFVVGGSYDIFQRGEPALYNALRLPTSQKKLLIGPWYHVTAGSGLPATDASGRRIPSLDGLALAWFDRWLKGKRNGIDRFPTVETYVLGLDKYVANSSFPMAGTSYADYYLSPTSSGSVAHSLNDGSLTTRRPAAGSNLPLPWLPANDACSRQTAQWSAGLAAASGDPCEADNRQNEAQSLTFTTPVMSRNTTLSGPMDLHLFTSSYANDTSLTAVVTDVAPDGTSTSVTGGSLIASQRAVTTTPCRGRLEYCSVYGGGRIVEPWHPYTYASQKPLEPNAIYDLQLEIFPTTAMLKKGHRLRVVVMSGDAPHRLDTASTLTGEASGGGLDTLYFGPAYPSRLSLGIAPLH